MTRPKRHTQYPLQYTEIVNTMFSTGKRGKRVCESSSEVVKIRNGFYAWRKALVLAVEKDKWTDEDEAKLVKDTLTFADRVFLQTDWDNNTVYFIPREEAADAKLLDGIEYE